MREFVRGVAMLAHGFAFWRQRPGVMWLALVPAAVVGAAFLAGLITLGALLPGITEALTPFADGWPALWATVIRIAIGSAMLGAALVLVAVSFTAVTLIVGDPFYARVWRAVEADLGGAMPDDGTGWWRTVVDGLLLFVRGVGVAAAAALVSFVPIIGGVVGTLGAIAFTGWLIADELTARALEARGMARAERRRLRRGRRLRVLGFGVATQLCFMVPLGAIVTMPAAVAGATVLARSLLDAAQDGDPNPT